MKGAPYNQRLSTLDLEVSTGSGSDWVAPFFLNRYTRSLPLPVLTPHLIILTGHIEGLTETCEEPSRNVRVFAAFAPAHAL